MTLRISMMLIRPIQSILVVDDDEVNRKVLGEILRRLGFMVYLAASADVASGYLELLGSWGLSAIISDLNMDGMNGLELQELASSILPEVPFLIMTGGNPDPQLRKRAAALGPMNFIEKPLGINPVHLRIVLRSHGLSPN
jgi:CheY-like chemotaxis protein